MICFNAATETSSLLSANDLTGRRTERSQYRRLRPRASDKERSAHRSSLVPVGVFVPSNAPPPLLGALSPDPPFELELDIPRPSTFLVSSRVTRSSRKAIAEMKINYREREVVSEVEQGRLEKKERKKGRDEPDQRKGWRELQRDQKDRRRKACLRELSIAAKEE